MFALSTTAAAGVDPSITAAITDLFGDGKNLILTVLAVGFFSVLLAVVAIKVGAKWAKRAVNQ